MDYLRWILLAAVVAVVVVIFLFSRSRKKNNYEMPLDEVDDVPSFSASDELHNGWVDGVGPVKVTSSFSAEDIPEEQEKPISTVQESAVEKIEIDVPSDANVNNATPKNTDPNNTSMGNVDSGSIESGSENKVQADDSAQDESIDDVISIYILAKNNEPLKGEKILSASYGLHLEHGEMKIFHRHFQTAKKDIQFSMANIEVPGWFDVDEMHQMETKGVSFFMQVNLVDKPSEALSEMLICAHSMSQMLGATLCNAQRKPLDEDNTNELREKVKRLEINKSKLV